MSNHLCVFCHEEMREVSASPNTDADSNYTHWVTYYCEQDHSMETVQEHRGMKRYSNYKLTFGRQETHTSPSDSD